MTIGYLVDSHILLWSLYEPKKLRREQHDILSGDAPSFVSVATIWEIEIKRAIGKLPLPENIWQQALQVGHSYLPITPEHAMHTRTLAHHHRDPFDRMLVAQAQIENLTIMTIDKHIRLYDVDCI